MSIRYTNKGKTPREKHYKTAKFPLGHSISKPPKGKHPTGKTYQTVVRIDGKKKVNGRWKRESHFMTITHTKRLNRIEIERHAQRYVRRTSEDFRIRKVVLVEGRKSPT